MTEEYNPLRHSVVQAFLKADATQMYEADDFIDALLQAVRRELSRVYWNVHQEQLDDRNDWQFLDIPGFEYRRYYWDDCDCGAESPVHDAACAKLTEGPAWNKRRLDAISVPLDEYPPTEDEVANLQAAGLDGPAALDLLGRMGERIDLSREAVWRDQNPPPRCTCGADATWTPKTHHQPTCSPQLPNLRFGKVTVNWYKRMGRGMSVSVDWDERRWRQWFDDVLSALRAYERARCWWAR
jgi:hypothetical protein